MKRRKLRREIFVTNFLIINIILITNKIWPAINKHKVKFFNYSVLIIIVKMHFVSFKNQISSWLESASKINLITNHNTQQKTYDVKIFIQSRYSDKLYDIEKTPSTTINIKKSNINVIKLINSISSPYLLSVVINISFDGKATRG